MLYSPLGTAIIVLVVGGLFLQACLAVVGSKRGTLAEQILRHVGEEEGRPKRARRDWRAKLAALANGTERSLGERPMWRRMERLIERADAPFGPAELLYMSGGGAFLGGLLGTVVAGAVAGFLLFCIGAAAPVFVLRRRAVRRRVAFEAQLPDLLISLASALRSGHSFKVGLQAIAEQGQPPASKELSRTLGEERLGRPLDEALEGLSQRICSKDLDFLLTAVSVQSQVGGSLATLCDTVAEAVRERQQFTRKLRAVTTTARTSARVLMAMPFGLLALISIVSPHYESPLFHSPTGRVVVVAVFMLVGMGSLVLRRMTTFKG